MRKTNIVLVSIGIGVVGLIGYARVLGREGLSIKATQEIIQICSKSVDLCAGLLNALNVTDYVLPDWRAAMQIALTAVLLGASLFVIMSHKYAPAQKHWAYGMIGTLLGFWLKP